MKIKVLVVMPGKKVQVVRMSPNIKFIKSFLGDELYKINLNESNIIIANKNAKIDEFNRIFRGDIILGTFLIVSVKNNHRVSMKKKDIRKYSNIFKLRKHQKRVEALKEEYLEEYYSNQRKLRQKNAERNKQIIFDIAA